MKFFKENWFLSLCILILPVIAYIDLRWESLITISLLVSTMMLFLVSGKAKRVANMKIGNLYAALGGFTTCLAYFFAIRYTVLVDTRLAVSLINLTYCVTFILLLIKIRRRK